MDSRRVLLIIAAILLAMVAGFGSFFLISDAKDSAKNSVETELVVVAKVDIPRAISGDSLIKSKDKYFEEKEVDATLATEDTLQPNELDAALKGKKARDDIRQGQFVLGSNFAAAGTEETVVLEIQEGYEAMSIQLDDVSGVGGFITQGDSINLIQVSEIRGADGNSPTVANKVAYYVMQDVKVLSVAKYAGTPSPDTTAVGETASSESASSVSTGLLTLEVTQEDAVRLSLAVQSGSLIATLVPGKFEPNKVPPVAQNIISYDSGKQGKNSNHQY